jgi:hypothetical protein
MPAKDPLKWSEPRKDDFCIRVVSMRASIDVKGHLTSASRLVVLTQRVFLFRSEEHATGFRTG